MKPDKNLSPAATSSARETRKAQKREKRAAKNAIVSIHKRPIVCPPDKAGRNPVFRLGGLLCRALVIWLSSSGLVIFLADAIQSGVRSSAIFLCSLIVVALGMIFTHSGVGKLIASLSTVGGVGTLLLLRPKLITDLPYGFVALYNATLNRLNRLGYWSYAKFRVDITKFTDTTEDLLCLEAICIITALITLLFVVCLSRKVHLVPPAILATSLIAVVLTFNIYSNSIKSNLGIALVIVSFASVLVMGAYDRLYRRTDRRRYDTELQLFEDNDRPKLPPEYLNEREARAAQKRTRIAARRKHRGEGVTVEEEIDDYFSTGKKKKKSLEGDASNPSQKSDGRELSRQLKAVKKYDRVTEEAKTAMGGYAAAAVMVATLLAIAIPALSISGNFSTIPAIDEKVELARNYVTALLRGDEKALDRLDYEANKDNFRPHSTNAEQLQFTGKQIFYFQSRYNTNFYMRGWLGLDYEDGAWLAVNDATLNRYHQTFGQDASPAEEMKYDFFYYMKPELVTTTDADPDRVYPDYYLDHFGSNAEYGFVATLINMRRVNSPSSLTYFPTSFVPAYGLMEFESVTPNELSYVNYYDGIYSGRGFDKNKLQYATVAYAPVMTNSFWIDNLSHLQASYSLQKEALLALMGISMGRDRLQMTTYEDENAGTIEFRYTLKSGRRDEPDTVWKTFHLQSQVSHASDSVTGQRIYTVQTPDGTLTLALDGKAVKNASIASPSGQDLLSRYNYNMTDAERNDLLNDIKRDRDYTAFVYDTYLDTADSPMIEELATKILNQAHTERLTETGYINIPYDVSFAALPNASNAAAYVQRDKLVRNVIDYIIDELGCRYTITPTTEGLDPELDGVENFLFNTKEGYCVQYASSVALILRELGIPTRYADGYVASGLNKASGDFSYSGYVRDNNAHAWVEVWFDGIGWVQYETTPEYYMSLYGVTKAVDSTVFPDPDAPETETETETETEIGPETETEPESETEAESETEIESESESESETEHAPMGVDPEALRRTLIGAGVLAVLAVIALILRAIASRAAKAEKERQDAVTRALESDLSDEVPPEERRAIATGIADSVMDLLSYLDLAPNPGEFREEFAERLTVALTTPLKDKKSSKNAPAPTSRLDDLDHDVVEARRKAQHEQPAPAVLPDDTPLPKIHVALAGMAAEEFGHGMSDAELREVAALYVCLHGQVKRRIPLAKRMKLRYVKRKI